MPQPAHAPRTLLAWSGGKDATMALARLRTEGSARVEALLTTVTADGRVGVHGVPGALLAAQARALGLPLRTVALPAPCPNAEYVARVGGALAAWAAEGGEAVAFGDLFLADLRAWREALLAPHGLRALFPLWGADTAALARAALDAGVRATLVAVDPARADPALCGRDWDAALLAALPPDVDPCGERGEFHTFVADGPGFAAPVPYARGAIVARDGHVYQELRPTVS